MGGQIAAFLACALQLHSYCASSLPLGRTVLRQPSELRTSEGSEEGYLTQTLDHFDATSTATFQQRFFVNASFFAGDGPVFLCVGGEGPALSEDVLSNSVHCNDMTELAPRAGALMFALEHRYYGASVPSDAVRHEDSLAEKLRFLSSQQATSDVAEFITQIGANYSLGPSNKWVTFGGSYPGMVSGFARLKLPNLVHAAVSSSSPWLAAVDMFQYNDIVADSLALPSVGGSAQCKAYVVDGHAAIRDKLEDSEKSRALLAVQFDFCAEDALEVVSKRRSWAGSGVIEVPSQENDPRSTQPASNIERICAMLATAKGDAVAKLAIVSKAQRGGACVRVEEVSPGWASELASRANATLTDAFSWPWQTCTEFAFFQTCQQDSRCPFARGYVTVRDEIAMCEQLFGISPEQVAQHVRDTNAYYGGREPRGSRILFPNGDVDPWSGLGVLVSPEPSEPAMLVSGSSHHFWTHPANEISQQTVRDAKAAIQAQVLDWLAEPP